jgi:hypothetical protein
MRPAATTKKTFRITSRIKGARLRGSWMVKDELIKNKEFEKIKKLVSEAVAAVKSSAVTWIGHIINEARPSEAGPVFML